MTKNYFVLCAVLFYMIACTPQIQQTGLAVSLIADGSTYHVTMTAGSTVQQALNAALIKLSQTDRLDPPAYSLISEGLTITVTRVREEFETQQVIIPFERQELHNESLLIGETRLIQAGKNGLREITIRHVFENDIDVSSSVVSENVLQTPIPEIVMIGVQSPFAPLAIPGKLVYLTGGNAWLMEGTTSNRRPLVTTGDIDGKIFSLSPDGKFLLFSRKSIKPGDQEINTLWIINTAARPSNPVDLGISNVVHFAAWKPGEEYLVAFSTVEPRTTAPGWQANNDLHFLPIRNELPGKVIDILDTNSGGIYGWWGITFAWSPGGDSLVYSRPDGVGLVNLKDSVLIPLVDITPLNTHSDWAWTPALFWSSDDRTIFLVNHAAPTGLVSPEESQNFDLTYISIPDDVSTMLIRQTGMFANPSVSSPIKMESNSYYLVAFLQAIFPSQSKTSRYMLDVVNGDGTNLRSLFPAEGRSGLEPQTPVWAPSSPDQRVFLGVIYEGNLWIVDADSGQSQQITGDGLTSQIDWK